MRTGITLTAVIALSGLVSIVCTSQEPTPYYVAPKRVTATPNLEATYETRFALLETAIAECGGSVYCKPEHHNFSHDPKVEKAYIAFKVAEGDYLGTDVRWYREQD